MINCNTLRLKCDYEKSIFFVSYQLANNAGRLGVVTITTDPAPLKVSTHTKYSDMLGTTMEKHLQKVVWF